MTLVLEVLLVAGGVLVGGWLGSTRRARRATPPAPSGRAEMAEPIALAGFPCGLGDVVVRIAERDEAWLAGALVFEEDEPVAALFVAPEAGGDRALFTRKGHGDLIWLSAVAPADLVLPQEPPLALEHGGIRYERVRRLPVHVTRRGSGAPDVGDRAVMAEYARAGAERIVAVVGSGHSLAWHGVALEKGDYDVLPGGKGTTG